MRIRRNQRVEVSCPHCAHVQWETAIAVSTFCRSCGEHLEISKGKAVLNGARNGDRTYLRVSSEESWNGDTAPAPRPAPKKNIPSSEKVETETNTEPDREGWLDNSPFSFRKGSPENDSRWSHRGIKPKLRSIACFECGKKQEVSAFVASCVCPACNAHVCLRKVHVRNDSRQKIKTRGDVTIHRRASLHGSSLACRDLKVLGKVSGSVDCSGDAAFYSECRIRGVFSCSTLSIRNKANVHFLRPVYAHNIVVTGEVKGDFYCSGSVTIGRTGSLTGELIARSVTVEPGGILDASLRVCSQEPAVAAPPPSAPEPESESEEVVLRPGDENNVKALRPEPALIDAAATSPA